MSVIYSNGQRNLRLYVTSLNKGADLLALLIMLRYRIIRVSIS